MQGYPIYILILMAVVLFAWLVQLFLQLTIQHKVLVRCKAEKDLKKASSSEGKPGVSVVVYAHNQGDALLRNLPSLLDNDYPDFEVIVVDDTSSDDTQDVLTIMEQRSDNLFHTRLTDKVKTMSHRKLALLLGVKAAHNEIIITTKAQCVPASKDWISSIVRNFNPEIDFVIAPVVFEGRVGVIARFCQFDLFQRMVSMFGITMSFRPFAGWGSNLAFRKHLLFDDNNKAFSRQLFIHPGEDDLMVAAMARHNNVAVECTPESMIVDQESPLSRAWSRDRVNRAFTAKRYSAVYKIITFVDYTTRYMCVLAGLVVAVWAGIKTLWIEMAVMLALLLIRYAVIATLSYGTSKALAIHRYLMSPVIYDLWVPIVDVWFWLRASVHNNTFYVGRVR